MQVDWLWTLPSYCHLMHTHYAQAAALAIPNLNESTQGAYSTPSRECNFNELFAYREKDHNRLN